MKVPSSRTSSSHAAFSVETGDEVVAIGDEELELFEVFFDDGFHSVQKRLDPFARVCGLDECPRILDREPPLMLSSHIAPILLNT